MSSADACLCHQCARGQEQEPTLLSAAQKLLSDLSIDDLDAFAPAPRLQKCCDHPPFRQGHGAVISLRFLDEFDVFDGLIRPQMVELEIRRR